MHFKSAAVTALLLGSTTAVDLYQFSKQVCEGNERVCGNLGISSCCTDVSPKQPNYNTKSCKCSGCTTKDTQYLMWPTGGLKQPCGLVKVSGPGGKTCLTGSAAKGYSSSGVNPPSSKSRRGVDEEFEFDPNGDCTPQRPDFYRIATRWFHTNDSMPEDDRAEFVSLWDSEILPQDIPAKFDVYETAPYVSKEQ